MGAATLKEPMSQNVTEFSPNQLKAIFWFATPEQARNPKTQQEFADKLGVRRETVSRWYNDASVRAEINRVARKELAKHLPEVYETLRKLAIKGSFQHMKLYLELLEEYSEEVNVNVNDKRERVIAELSEFERRRATKMGA